MPSTAMMTVRASSAYITYRIWLIWSACESVNSEPSCTDTTMNGLTTSVSWLRRPATSAPGAAFTYMRKSPCWAGGTAFSYNVRGTMIAGLLSTWLSSMTAPTVSFWPVSEPRPASNVVPVDQLLSSAVDSDTTTLP